MTGSIGTVAATAVIAAAFAVPAIAQTDESSDPETSQAGPVGGEYQFVPGIGPARLTESGLLEVRLPDGTTITTHGADPAPSAESDPATTEEESLGAIGVVNEGVDTLDPAGTDEVYVASSIGREPVCVDADTAHFRALYTWPAGDENRSDRATPVVRAAVREMTKRLFDAGRDYSNDNVNVDYRFNCYASGAISVGEYRSSSTTTSEDLFSDIVGDARAAGYTNPDAKYLIFYDDPSRSACGRGQIFGNDTRSVSNPNNNTQGAMYAVVYGRTCWKNGGTALHETTHTMGGVQPTAPRGTTAYHCTDERDVLCYNDKDPDRSVSLVCDTERYDCHHNDYFDTGAASGYLQDHWNIGWTGNRFLVIR